MAANVIQIPVARRDVPRTQPSDHGDLPANVHRLFPPLSAHRAEPRRSPEMMIILALISALEKRQGLKTIKTKAFYALTGQDDREDGDYRPPSAALRAAVDAMCGH